jgi:AbrB family looped-hinge helix DNA binding protein
VALTRVLARGQITIPREIRKKAGIKPGDLVVLDVVEPGKVELHTLPRMTLAEMLERYHIDEPIDWEHFTEDWQEIAARDAMGER